MTLRASLALGLWLLLPGSLLAHKPSDSYLRLRLAETGLAGEWDIALRDLEVALGLDADQDGAITWGELRARHADVAAYALGHLTVTAGGEPCRAAAVEHRVDRHSDGAYAVLRFRLDCAAAETYELDYRLFFDIDPSHRGLLRIESSGSVDTAVLSPEKPRFDVRPQVRGAWQAFGDYVREGIWHIWIGFDHVLFLLALLLPAGMVRRDGAWQAVDTIRPAAAEVLSIVTSFTVAHSVTLTVAVLGWVSLPSRWVELVIAATVVVAAVHNLRPLMRGRRSWIAFVLGLVHGFGFAGVLVDLGLSDAGLARALLGFNLGVEIGQLVIVAVFVPIAFVLRSSWFYRRAVLQFGSVLVALVALAWLAERSLDLRFMPF